VTSAAQLAFPLRPSSPLARGFEPQRRQGGGMLLNA
jgi:hypothetical protein